MTVWIDSQVCQVALFAFAVYFGIQFFGPLQKRKADE